MPIEEIMSPKVVAMKPLIVSPLVIDAVAERAKTNNMKYSAGPKCSAKRATGSATATMITVAMIPPINDAIAEIASAASARPLSVIGYPSNVAATAAPAPGVLIRIDERDPPYIAP